MPRTVVKVGAATGVTCLLDGITLLHTASVTTSAVDTDKDDSHPPTKKS
jgi:hypothetical protein